MDKIVTVKHEQNFQDGKQVENRLYIRIEEDKYNKESFYIKTETAPLLIKALQEKLDSIVPSKT